MGQGIKLFAGGLALFVLGGVAVYFISQPNAANIQVVSQEQSESAPIVTTPATNTAPDTSTGTSTDTSATTTAPTESFYAAAEARREQVLINKEESDRIAKLKATKERSVECKFWKQQQKTSSAAAKIEEKINEHCNLPSSSSASSSDSASSSSTTPE